MYDKHIKKKVLEIACDVLDYDMNGESKVSETQVSEIFYRIISNSLKATNFVVLIEDEYDIEFDDDEINIEFFSDLKYLCQVIKNHIG